jgi:hypothetical protein
MTDYAEQFAMSKYASSADRSAAMLAKMDRLRGQMERLTAERDALRDWVNDAGLQMNICTRNILGKVCEYCQCKHRKATP